MQVIDTHQHLILRDRLRYGWTEGIPTLAAGSFGVQAYARAAAGGAVSGSPAACGGAEAGGGGAVVVGTVFMETGVDDADYRAEAEIVSGMIGAGGIGAGGIGSGGMLGQVASIRPERDAGFEDWLDQAGRLGIVGYRRLLHVADPALSQGPVFRRNLRKIGARGLPFDLCLFARQLGLAEDLLRVCPDQVFVLDHGGNPEVGAGGFAPWAAAITRLAGYSNLVVKLSGITTNCAPGPVTAAALRPFVDHLLACFGPDRMLWGSDWPVVNLATGLGDWLALTRALLGGLTAAEQFAIGQGTARRVYRLPPRAGDSRAWD